MIREIDIFHACVDRLQSFRKNPSEAEGQPQNAQRTAGAIHRGLEAIAAKHLTQRIRVILRRGQRKQVPYPADVNRIEVSTDHGGTRPRGTRFEYGTNLLESLSLIYPCVEVDIIEADRSGWTLYGGLQRDTATRIEFEIVLQQTDGASLIDGIPAHDS